MIMFITFMQGISNYIPKPNNVPRVYNFAALLWLKYMIPVLLFPITKVLHFYISVYGRICAVPSMACFCSFMNFCFPGTFVRYFVNNF